MKPTAAHIKLYYKYKCKAKKRRLRFDLTKDLFFEIIKMKCWYCGKRPTQKIRRGKHVCRYNGIDRAHNNVGYIPSNVLPCCGTCNKLKSVMSYQKFINQIIRIYDNTVGNY